MTLLQLSYFVTLAEHLHYTKTAELLHISQPSLSYAISEMEKDLGVKLFQKEKQGVSLSDYGREYYPYAKKALETLERGRSAVTAMASSTETVIRWGYFHSVSATLIPTLIRSFHADARGSSIRFQLIEDSVQRLLTQLHSGDLDMCFTCHQESWATSVPIAHQPLYLAVPADHPLTEKSFVTLEDFAAEPQIMLTLGSDLRLQMDQFFHDNGVVPRTAYEVRECNAALQYVALKIGVAVLPQVPVMGQEDIAVLPILTPEGRELSRTIYLSYHKTRPLTAAQRFVVDFILRELSAAE